MPVAAEPSSTSAFGTSAVLGALHHVALRRMRDLVPEDRRQGVRRVGNAQQTGEYPDLVVRVRERIDSVVVENDNLPVRVRLFRRQGRQDVSATHCT